MNCTLCSAPRGFRVSADVWLAPPIWGLIHFDTFSASLAHIAVSHVVDFIVLFLNFFCKSYVVLIGESFMRINILGIASSVDQSLRSGRYLASTTQMSAQGGPNATNIVWLSQTLIQKE